MKMKIFTGDFDRFTMGFNKREFHYSGALNLVITSIKFLAWIATHGSTSKTQAYD